MSDGTESIVEKWEEIRALVDSLDLDVRKNARGNVSAGIRARKGLRELKTWTSELVKSTIKEEKVKKAVKKASKD